MMGLAKEEMDTTVSQLAKARKGYESEIACLNSKLLAQEKESEQADE